MNERWASTYKGTPIILSFFVDNILEMFFFHVFVTWFFYSELNNLFSQQIILALFGGNFFHFFVGSGPETIMDD
jgi:hypothetical protein